MTTNIKKIVLMLLPKRKRITPTRERRGHFVSCWNTEWNNLFRGIRAFDYARVDGISKFVGTQRRRKLGDCAKEVEFFGFGAEIGKGETGTPNH